MVWKPLLMAGPNEWISRSCSSAQVSLIAAGVKAFLLTRRTPGILTHANHENDFHTGLVRAQVNNDRQQCCLPTGYCWKLDYCWSKTKKKRREVGTKKKR